MRLFLAVFPTKEQLDYLRDMLRRFDKQKRNLIKTPVDQLHITLKFLSSNVSEHSKNLIVDELLRHQGSFTKPVIEIDKLTYGFPKEFFPKILMAKLKPHQELNSLVDEVHAIVKSLKLRDTKRWKGKYPYNHHITLARLKYTATKSTAKLLYSHTLNLPGIVPPKPHISEEMYLVKSETEGNTSNPKYTRLEKIRL